MTREYSELTTKMDVISTLIEETEGSLSKSSLENAVLESELKGIRREYERQTNMKIELEEKILNVLQDQISTDHASKSRAKNVLDLQTQRRDLELTLFSTEEKLSEILFELEKLKGIVTRSKVHVDDLTVSSDFSNYCGHS